MATVSTLEAARRVVDEAGGNVTAVYEYTQAVTGERLWSVEWFTNAGCTLRSEHVAAPRLVYDHERGWL